MPVLRRWLGRRQGLRGDAGSLALLYTFASMMIFGIAALAVDLAHARDVQRQAQEAADAAVLAGGNALYAGGRTPDVTAAIAAVRSYAKKNYGTTPADWQQCTDPAALTLRDPLTSCISFDLENATSETSSIRVVLPTKEVETPFAALFGTRSVHIRRMAESAVNVGGRAPCGVCLLGSTTHDLQNGTLLVTGTSVKMNGSFDQRLNGLITVTGGTVGIEGSIVGTHTNISPLPTLGIPHVKDPLAFLTLPPDSSALINRSSQNPCLLGPGRYGTVKKFVACVLPSGLYVITGTWSLTGNESILGNGVTLYFTCGTSALPRPCTSGEAGGALDAAGNGGLGLTAPTTGATKGLAIVYDRENTSPLRFTGNALTDTTGTIYAKSAALDFRGNGTGHALDALTVVKDLVFKGNPTIARLIYTEANNVEIPPQALHLTQ